MYRACGTFLYAPSIFRTDTDVRGFIQERDLCYAQISSLSSCTRMYNCLTVYFKRLTERVFYYVATENPQRISTATDGGGFKQEQVCLQTCSPKMDKDVHFWARMSVVPCSSDVFALFNRASTASLCQKRVSLYAFQHHIAERLISYTCNENRIVVAQDNKLEL